MSDATPNLEDFTGLVRLFPLPNLVMFPSVIQPLHIFEPRYRQMTADALAGDRLIALVLLAPGWEEDYEGRPPIHPVACLGQIITHQRLEDGRYNLLLRGLHRIRIVAEVSTSKLYRTARVELLEDHGLPGPDLEKDFRRQLAGLIPRWSGGHEQEFQGLLAKDLSAAVLCDILSFALPLPIALKQELLEQQNVQERLRALLHHLHTQGGAPGTPRPFPPEFSPNGPAGSGV
jgi:Lon protease-like protein